MRYYLLLLSQVLIALLYKTCNDRVVTGAVMWEEKILNV
jgi:hypothetical protein